MLRIEELMELLRHYLSFSSTDGRLERRQLRKQLGEMVGVVPEEQKQKKE